jgi:uncharacterized protein
MYEEYLKYVKDYLINHNGIKAELPEQTFRDRYEHTIRVIKWLEIISEGMEVDREALYLAAVFHDIGYEDKDNKLHGKRGAAIFSEFAKKEGFSDKLIEKVAYMIEQHSDKSILGTDIPIELTLLMEADQMDEEGTMRVLWDCLVTGKLGADSYRAAYDRMMQYKSKMPNAMVTPRAKAIWDMKSRLYNEFLRQLEADLFIDDKKNIYKEGLK